MGKTTDKMVVDKTRCLLPIPGHPEMKCGGIVMSNYKHIPNFCKCLRCHRIFMRYNHA